MKFSEMHNLDKLDWSIPVTTRGRSVLVPNNGLVSVERAHEGARISILFGAKIPPLFRSGQSLLVDWRRLVSSGFFTKISAQERKQEEKL